MKSKLLILATALALTACQSTDNANGLHPRPVIDTQNSTWDSQYGGADKSYDTELLAQREGLAGRFQVLEYTAENGVKIAYNLYAPKNLDPGKKYPLVMFIADASTAGKGVKPR